jgi:hypothetical protein
MGRAVLIVAIAALLLSFAINSVWGVTWLESNPCGTQLQGGDCR